jgi:hypothetical protein
MTTATAMAEIRAAKKARLRLSCSPGRHQRRYFHFQGLSQKHQFKIRDASQLRLNFREGGAAQFQPQDAAAGGKHFLRQTSLVSQFPDLWADNVLRPISSFCHAPEMELDTNKGRPLNCSVFGATCRNVPARVPPAMAR